MLCNESIPEKLQVSKKKLTQEKSRKIRLSFLIYAIGSVIQMISLLLLLRLRSLRCFPLYL